MAFGPEPEYVRHLGYYYALAHIDVDDEDLMYNEPGRMAATGGIKAPAFFVFASAPLEYDRDDIAQQKQLVIRHRPRPGRRLRPGRRTVPGERRLPDRPGPRTRHRTLAHAFPAG
jgi:hypothetical protein